MLLDAVPPAEDAADGVLARPGGVVGVVAVGGGGGGGRGGVAAAAVLARVPVVMHPRTHKLNPAKRKRASQFLPVFPEGHVEVGAGVGGGEEDEEGEEERRVEGGGNHGCEEEITAAAAA